MIEYVVQNLEGETFGSDEFPLSKFGELVSTLDEASEEHPDISVTHRESGWHLTITSKGTVILSKRFEQRRRLRGVDRDTVLKLMSEFAVGGPDSVSTYAWQ